MSVFKLPGSAIQANTITTTQLLTTVVTQISAGGGPKVTTITYPNSATAAVNTGNESIVLTGTGFESGVQVYINGSAAPAVSRTNSTSLSFTTPALSTGTTYPLYVVNPDGGTAVVVPGMVVSAGPVWVTGSALSGWNKDSALSTTLQANSDSTVSYALDIGSSLPSGITLAANGLLSGTLTSPPGAQTTYNFTVTATDLELQKSSKAFSINATMGITATGGTVSNIAGYRVHTFTSSGSFQVTSGSGDIEYLVVAGGGKGGHAGWGGGGGGAGGLLTGNVSVSPGTYTVTVGGGGSGGTSMYTPISDPGSNSSIVGSGVSVIGIGGGGGSGAGGGSFGYGFPGGNGGSGGGAAQRLTPSSVAGGKGVYPGSSYISASRQGYDGGWVLGGSDSGGGGGGAGGAGANTSGSGGNGGIGLQSNISGTAIYYAGGGAGGGGSAVGGNGGGGNTATSGTANRGGGGGGNNFDNTVGNGGSGIVIIRYAA